MVSLLDSSKDEDNLFPQKNTFQINGRLIIWDRPLVMGIVNLTPDSFYEDSRTNKSLEVAKSLLEKHIVEGADILDLGGYSSRPGADDISVSEEEDRVLPVVEWLATNFPETLISIDTFRSQVAEKALDSGAHIVNDISAGELDPEMLPLMGRRKNPYIAMHMRGNPKTMQQHTNYEDVILDIMYYFAKKQDEFKKFGIKDVIIDPGFGFAKTIKQNFWILKNLQQFRTFPFPILVGLSRKSMVYRTLKIDSSEALNGSTALHMHALGHGANILRVHDVKEAKQTVELYNNLYPII
jgi:dihydropteroate synthase